MEENTLGCVYFFRHIGLSPVKIGFTTSKSPIDRFNSFRTYAPYGSEILGFIQTDTPKHIESTLHSKFSSKRLEGEWFNISEDEVNAEVEFHSNIESIKERNQFQIAWAKKLADDKSDIKFNLDEIKSYKPQLKITNQIIFNKMYAENTKVNRHRASLKLGVSRATIHRWIREINTKDNISKKK